MKNNTNSIYYSRTDTKQSIVIVWKPFCTYSTYIFLAIAIIGILTSMTELAFGAFLLLFVNTVIYSVACKNVRKEINEAYRKSCVQVTGNKFSWSSPLTVTISKSGQSAQTNQEALYQSSFCQLFVFYKINTKKPPLLRRLLIFSLLKRQ